MARVLEPYYDDEFVLINRIDNLKRIARNEGYTFNESKLQRDIQSFTKKADGMTNRQRVNALLDIVHDIEMQMFGEERTMWSDENNEYKYRNKSKSPKPKRKVAKKKTKSCGCK